MGVQVYFLVTFLGSRILKQHKEGIPSDCIYLSLKCFAKKLWKLNYTPKGHTLKGTCPNIKNHELFY